MIKTITASEYKSMKKEGEFIVLDVRTPDEYKSWHLAGSVNITVDDIEKGNIHGIPRDKTIYLVCHSGARSERAYQILKSMAYDNLVCIEGGVLACAKEEGLAVPSRLPIMRQVQLVAGLLVVLGVLGSWIIHPGWLYVSLFVGCGLTFAGLTGFCGMARLLEKMPWNKI